MGLTSCRWITIAGTLARRRRGCATGIMPVALSLSNAPPTATPSSVMSRFLFNCGLAQFLEWVRFGFYGLLEQSVEQQPRLFDFAG
jgi:hypothetical protein